MNARRRTDAKRFPVEEPDLQIEFWARLQQIRSKYLIDALTQAVREVDLGAINAELDQLVGSDALEPLTMQQLRGELFFPVPCLLGVRPQLLGYYRLLYGFSQKQFYRKAFGRFKAMEESNKLTDRLRSDLEGLCKSLISTGIKLLATVQPISLNAVHELQLLTLGPQFRGSNNVAIGQAATKEVFELIRKLVARHIESSAGGVLSVKNAAGRIVQIAFAADPDITIIETMPTTSVPSTSIEIKGGVDRSNIHNRIGEAEKSHLNAKVSGFTRFWTILNATVDDSVARSESPTTTNFFALDQLRNSRSSQHTRLTIGIA